MTLKHGRIFNVTFDKLKIKSWQIWGVEYEILDMRHELWVMRYGTYCVVFEVSGKVWKNRHVL